MGDVTLSVAIDSSPAQSGAADVRAEIEALTAKVTTMISAFDGAGTQMAAALAAISSSTGGAVSAMGNLDAATRSAAGQMSQWRQELAQQQAAQAQGRAADADYHAQALQLTAAFWEQKASLAQSGSREQLEASRAEAEVEKQLYQQQAADAARAAQVRKAIDKEQANSALQMSKIQLDEEKDNLDAAVTAGTLSQQEKFAALTAFELRKYGIDDGVLAHELESLQAGTLAWQQAYDKREILAENHRRQLAQIGKQETAERNAEVKAWEAPVGSAMNTMISGYLQGTQTLTQIAAKAGQAIAVSYAQKGVGMAADWLHSHVVMAAYDKLFASQSVATITLAETAKTTATRSGTTARTATQATESSSFLGRIGTQIAAWLGLETGKTAETAAGAAQRAAADGMASAESIASAKAQAAGMIPAYTEIAAMGAASAMASIPYVGPALAAAAAAEMEAMGAAAMAVASAEGGWGEVPYDGAPAVLHKQEMVLPAALATPLRAMLTSGSSSAAAGVSLPASLSNVANSNAPAAASQQIAANGGGGDTHVHFSVSAIDSKGVDGFFKQHGPKIAKTVRDQARNFSASAQTVGKKS